LGAQDAIKLLLSVFLVKPLQQSPCNKALATKPLQ
jgi:hypothetical protein